MSGIAESDCYEALYRRSELSVSCATEDGLLLVPVRDGSADLADAVAVNGVGQFLWEKLDRELTSAEIGEAVAGEYEIDAETARADARAFLDALVVRELVDRVGDAGAARVASGVDPVDAGGFVALARATLAAGHTVRFRARGLSMRPQIPDGTVLEVAPCALADVRLGDVVAYSEGGRLVAHRVFHRAGDELWARGDTAARADRVTEEQLLGVVTATIDELGARTRIDGGARRAAGLTGGLCHRVGAFCAKWLVVMPLKNAGFLRAAVRGTLGIGSKLLRLCERKGASLRRRLDVGYAALLDEDEKDERRRVLYDDRSVQDFTALDENVVAGLTLIEEVLLSRHDLARGPTLVLGCGPGRECVALAEQGFAVTGIDRSEGMLARARTLAAERGQQIRFVRGEAGDFALDEEFENIVVFSGLYNMVLPGHRRVALLDNAREHLTRSGRVVITFLSDYVRPGSEPGPDVTRWSAINPSHEQGDLWLINEAVHVFPHPEHVAREARAAGLVVEALFRDQRAYDKATRQVRGYAIFRQPE